MVSNGNLIINRRNRAMARPARVTTLSMSGVVGDGPDERIKRTTDAMLKAIDEVASDDPDIIVFTECLPYLGLSLKEQVEYAQPLDGWIVRSVAEKAKENKAYIICPIYQRKKDKVYNSSVLIDRNGEVLGVYNKHVPTIGEMEAGISPGIDTPVFQTDFGKISMVICFDLNFREAFIDPVEKGTEAFFFSSMFRGGALLSMRALEFGTYII
jgi:predicted amidohydrolase